MSLNTCTPVEPLLTLITAIVISVLVTKITMLFHTIVTRGMHQAGTGVGWQWGGLSYDDKRETSHTVGEFVPQERSGGVGGGMRRKVVLMRLFVRCMVKIYRVIILQSLWCFELCSIRHTRGRRVLCLEVARSAICKKLYFHSLK